MINSITGSNLNAYNASSYMQSAEEDESKSSETTKTPNSTHSELVNCEYHSITSQISEDDKRMQEANNELKKSETGKN